MSRSRALGQFWLFCQQSKRPGGLFISQRLGNVIFSAERNFCNSYTIQLESPSFLIKVIDGLGFYDWDQP